jgi:NAD(P)-dependent dehydrogenase (short-subunit alcohol dehydrogenase family)
MLNVNFYFVS